MEDLTLRWRFRLVVLTFAVPLFANIVWSTAHQSAIEMRRIRAETRSDAILLAARLDAHIEQVDRLLANAARSIGRDIIDTDSIDALLQGTRSLVPQSVDVWSLDGASVASLNRLTVTHHVNVSDRPYFVAALARRVLSIEGPIASGSTGVQSVTFARPIFDARNRIVGVLSLSIRPSELIGQLDRTDTASATSLVTIIARHGTTVVRSVEPAGTPVRNEGSVETLFAQRQGTREETDAEGVRSLVGFATVGARPLVVSVSEPVDTILPSKTERLLQTLAVGIALFGLAFFIAGRVAAWTARPLLQLADDTDRLRAGELSHRSGVVIGGEVALLAANFNSMAAVLEERERALATSRQQLTAIADNMPAQMYYLDQDERFCFVNNYRSPFPGSSAAELLGKTVREARGEELYPTTSSYIKRALAGETLRVEASRFFEGREYHFQHIYVPDVAEDGAVSGIYCFAQDITERKEADQLRIESEKRLVMITDNLPAMICYIDENRCFRFANKPYEKSFKRPLDEIIGQPFHRLLQPAISARYDDYFLRVMQGESVDCEMEVPRGDGGSNWLKCCFIPDIDETSGKARGLYGLLHNVTREKVAEQYLTQLAQFDTLTGLANRYQFNMTLGRTLNERGSNVPLALMFLDIDHFKQVNDRYGHACGDTLLKEFAQRLAESVRETDAVARFAGDEFVVLLVGIHSDNEAQFVARKIIAAVEKPFVIEQRVLHVTTSIGIAMRADAEEIPSTLMRRADEALYEAKRNGRNRFHLAVS